MRFACLLLVGLLSAQSALAASIDKAKALRSNGLLDEAKRELLDLAFAEESPPEVKAEALLILGDIAIDQNRPTSARESWERLLAEHSETTFAATARTKLKALEETPSPTPGQSAHKPGTVLVVGPTEYAWAAPQIAGSLAPPATPFKGTLPDAFTAATSNPDVVGVVEVALDVESVFESGRVVCYTPAGAKKWEQKVRVSSPGGAEHIARRFVDKLSTRVKGRRCP